MSKRENQTNCRLNKVGGQAVLEGVMMKAGENTVTTCRKDDGTLIVYDDSFVSIRKKHKILNIPILRGVVNFIEMMVLSVKTLNNSADALGIEEEETKFELWLKKHFGVKVMDFIMLVATLLGVALSMFLFIFLPTWIADGINWLLVNVFKASAMSATVTAIIEGALKMGIFVCYLALVSLMKDIKRTFMYHGAEHKSIACFESGEELTPENAMKHKRFHPRCGTSFMFLMILLGIFAGMFVRNIFPGLPSLAYAGIKVLTLPLVMGIGYEILMVAGKHDNVITRIISAPGMWVQRITTKEPTPDMLECAIISIKCALRNDYPEFMEFYLARPWEAGNDTAPTQDAEANTAANEKSAEENLVTEDESTEENDAQ